MSEKPKSQERNSLTDDNDFTIKNTPVQSDFRNKMNVLSDAAEPASLSICAMGNDHVNP